MSENTKLTHIITNITDEVRPSEVDRGSLGMTTITDADKTPEVKKLESLVYGLDTKIIILAEHISQLNERIVSLMTLQEELLYTIDQSESREDNIPQFTVDFEEKKFGLN